MDKASSVLPETMVLISKFGDISFACGAVAYEAGECSTLSADLVKAKGDLIRHLEKHYQALKERS